MAEHQLLAAFLGLVTASVAPVTAYVSSANALAVEKAKSAAQLSLETEREKNTRAKDQRAQDHEIRMAYFSKAIDPALDVRDRERVLRFLARSFADKDLRDWAADELKSVQRTIAEVEQRNRAVEAQRAAIEHDLRMAKTALERASAEQKRSSLEHEQFVDAVGRASGELKSKIELCKVLRRSCESERTSRSCVSASECETDLAIALKWPTRSGGIHVPR